MVKGSAFVNDERAPSRAGSHRAHAMEPEWLSYAQAAERLTLFGGASNSKWLAAKERQRRGGRASLVALEPRSPDEPPMSAPINHPRRDLVRRIRICLVSPPNHAWRAMRLCCRYGIKQRSP